MLLRFIFLGPGGASLRVWGGRRSWRVPGRLRHTSTAGGHERGPGPEGNATWNHVRALAISFSAPVYAIPVRVLCRKAVAESAFRNTTLLHCYACQCNKMVCTLLDCALKYLSVDVHTSATLASSWLDVSDGIALC